MSGDELDREESAAGSWMIAMVQRRLREMLPGMVADEIQRIREEIAEVERNGICVCRTCGSVLGAHEEAGPTRIMIADVQRVVAREFGIPHVVLIGDSRKHETVAARRIAIHLAQQLTGAMTSTLARSFRRDPASIAEAARKAKAEIAADPELRVRVDAIADILNNKPAA